MDPEIKTQVLRKMTYGMWVLSAAAGGDVEASTVCWLSQASFSPPLVMVAVKAGTHLCEVVEKAGAFALHLVGEDALAVAEAFVKPTEVKDGKIGGVAHTPGAATGSPILEGFTAWLEAKVTDTVKRGDATVFVAEVVGAGQRDAGTKPLVLANTPWKHYGG
jgi:flavin reductase (DIM6/NTAB) family NADH-FMN oxidoreductase RutF